MAAVQKHTLPSFSCIISVLSIVFYCVGFIRVELEMNKQKNRINALENVAEAKPKSNEADMEIKNAPGKLVLPPRFALRILLFRARQIFKSYHYAFVTTSWWKFID